MEERQNSEDRHDRLDTPHDRQDTAPGAETAPGLTRRRLLQAGAGAFAALTLAGWPVRADDTPAGTPAGGAWFDTGDGMPGVRDGNAVLELIDGYAAFTDMALTLKTAGYYSFVYLLNWWVTDSFPLLRYDANSALLQLLTRTAQSGGQVRAMFWDQFGTQNSAEVSHINAITLPADPTRRADAAAILDNRTLTYGAHHQKVLIVGIDHGDETADVTAYCGGIDFNPDRLRPQGQSSGGGGSGGGAVFLHDVHCRIRGPAAGDLLQVFVERWNDHPDVRALPPELQALRGQGLIARDVGGSSAVQIGRTYGNGTAHGGIGAGGYSFAPFGERTARRMFLKAIANARQYIYIEDQYLVNMEASAALLAALPNIEFLIILIPHASITDLGVESFPGSLLAPNQSGYRRRLFLAPLHQWDRDNGTSKVHVFSLANPGAPHTYVHSKTWIFDDQYAIIGSANCGRRSWTHDSEVVAGIADPAVAKRLRMDLWQEHLRVDTPALLADPLRGAAHWTNPGFAARITPYDETVGGSGPDFEWNTFIDPDGS